MRFKKTILKILIALSILMTGLAYYLYTENDITERKSRLVMYVKNQLKNTPLPTNEFDEKIDAERHILNRKSIELSTSQIYTVSKCLETNKYIGEKEKCTACAEILNKTLIDLEGEESLVKAIAHSYFSSGIKYLTLGGTIKMEKFKNSSDENSDYFKAISYSGYLNSLRDPKKLSNFYAKYKPLLHSYITEKLYQKNLKPSIDNLLNAYQKLEIVDNRNEYLKEIDEIASQTHSHSDLKNWSFTFWHRRALENNDEIIYTILKEVKNHYEQNN